MHRNYIDETLKLTRLYAPSGILNFKTLQVKSLLTEIAAPAPKRAKLSLLDQAYVLKKQEALNPELTALKKKAREEAEVMKEVSNVQVKALTTVAERARGIVYTEVMKSSWRPFPHTRKRTEEENEALRNKLHIIVEVRNAKCRIL